MTPLVGGRLALEGGEPVCRRQLPVPFNASGRMYGEAELARLRSVLARGTLTRWGGEMVDALEREWAARVGVKHAVAVASGTAALHTALASLQVPVGREVVTSPITDMGTVIAILHNHLIPVFADVHPHTGMITAETIERCLSPHTAAIVPVHLFGRCVGIDAIARLAKARDITLIEDSSQAHFSKVAGRMAGSFGAMGCFSLQQTKVVSCGEGGLIVTDDDEFESRARLFQNKGWKRDATSDRTYPTIGLNYRLGELAAAVALGQLEAVEENIARRAASHGRAARLLQEVPGVSVCAANEQEAVSWWALAVRFEHVRSSESARFIEAALAAEGVPFLRGYIGARPIFDSPVIRGRAATPSPDFPWSLRPERRWTYEPDAFPGALDFLTRCFVRIWCEGLNDDDVDVIVAAIAKVAKVVESRL